MVLIVFSIELPKGHLGNHKGSNCLLFAPQRFLWPFRSTTIFLKVPWQRLHCVPNNNFQALSYFTFGNLGHSKFVLSRHSPNQFTSLFQNPFVKFVCRFWIRMVPHQCFLRRHTRGVLLQTLMTIWMGVSCEFLWCYAYGGDKGNSHLGSDLKWSRLVMLCKFPIQIKTQDAYQVLKDSILLFN